MKQLSILLQGEFAKIDLVTEIEDFGHRVVLNQEINPEYDCIIFSSQKEFLARQKFDFAKAQLILNANQVLLYKNNSESYLLATSEDEPISSSESIIDAITILARGELNNLALLPFAVEDLAASRQLSAADYQLQINSWNATTAAYPENKTLAALFEEQVLRTPEAIALVYAGRALTYLELNEKANQLANYLRQQYSISADDLIGLCLDRSEQMLIAILAVLKAGGAYVPLDPSYPDERINYILEDTGLSLVLTNQIHQRRCGQLRHEQLRCEPLGAKYDLRIEVIDSQLKQAEFNQFSSANLSSTISSHNLAYVIYTSGTTGKPKGVMLEQQGIINTVLALNDVYDLKHGRRISAFTSYTFDVSVSEFFSPLLRGGELHLLAEDVRHDVDLISQYILSQQINYIYLPPVVLAALPRIDYPSLYGIVYAGEPCDANTGKYWSEHKKLFNYYGPTETSIYALGKIVQAGDVSLIGRPIQNSSAYILDGKLQPLAIGAIGELYLGGVGLARGYLKRPELTAERFIANPYQSSQEKAQGLNSRLYKTGDLVRYLADGNIEYIGRNDFQVKIRGFRIELGEIENKLGSYPAIQQAVVLAHQLKPANSVTESVTELTSDSEQTANSADAAANSKYLAAFYVAATEIKQDELLAHLATQLPDYMLPSVFIQLAKLPLTTNGKLDRNKLLSLLDDFPAEKEHDYSAYGPIEAYLANLWQELIVTTRKKIELSDSFFWLGGHSLLVTRLILKLRKEYKVTLTPHQVYSAASLAGLADLIRNSQQNGLATATNLQIEPRYYSACPNNYRLVKYQLSIYFADLGDSQAYTVPYFVQLNLLLDGPRAVTAFCRLVAKHRILAGAISQSDAGLIHTFADENYQPQIEELTEAELALRLNQLASHQFEISKELSDFRILQVKAKDGDYSILSFTHHHLVADGYALDLMLREYLDFYFNPENMNIDTYNYADVLSLISPVVDASSQSFFSQLMANLQNPHFSLPADCSLSRTSNTTNSAADDVADRSVSDCAEFKLVFSSAEKSSIRRLAQQHKTTINAILLSGLYLALQRFTREENINLGVVFANRDNPLTENLIGCLVNTLPFEVNFSETTQNSLPANFITEIVRRLNEYMQYGSHSLQDLLAVSQSGERLSSWFNLIFASQHINPQINSKCSYNKIMPLNLKSKFDLAFNFYHTLDPERLEIEYNATKYSSAYIASFCKTLQVILTQLATSSATPLKELAVLSAEDYQQQIYYWNLLAADYPASKTVALLFEEQVLRTPHNPALVYDDIQLSYLELNICANQLANYLRRNYQIQADDVVALCLDRSELMLIAILAIFKAGAAYLPLDPSYPDERISYVLEDSQARLVLSNQVHLARLSAFRILALDSVAIQELLAAEATENLIPINSSRNLAYVIYTSGTTGKPKGVMIEHASVMNLCSQFVQIHRLADYRQLAIYSNYVFDAFVYEVMPGIVNGNQLFLLNDEIRLAPQKLASYLAAKQIQVMFIPTIMIQEVLSSLAAHNSLAVHSSVAVDNPLRLIYSGGEKLPILDQIYFKGQLTLLNEYGPTEASVCSTFKEYQQGVANTNIGRPIANFKAYILDANLQPLPVGAIGELYIGGVGLARGYLNRPELTAQRFIANPFQSAAEIANDLNSRLYKSGDLVRYLASGDIEYIGRNDFQVKIRGFRIELGEIEAVINRYIADDGTPIRQSVVLALEHKDANGQAGNNKYLAAYYVASQPVAKADLFKYLNSNLPDYMQPAVLIHLERLPQTLNGKLDQNKLPAAEFNSEAVYLAPSTPLEKAICAIYAEVLALDSAKVGLNDDFFRLGGNSIIAIRLVNRLNTATEIKISVSEFFKTKTINDLLQVKHGEHSPLVIPAMPASVRAAAGNDSVQGVLSFAQERLWFYEKYSGGSYAYNIPVLYTLNRAINLELLEQALLQTVARHEILHTLIATDNDGQGYFTLADLNHKPLPIPKYEIASTQQLHDLVRHEANHVYDLANEYPIRISLYTQPITGTQPVTGGGVNYLAIVIHHIAFDGWSMDVFLRDLEEYYAHLQRLAAGANNSQLALPELSIQYQDFAVWQKNYLNGDYLAEQLAYWQQKLSGYSSLNLITDFLRPALVNNGGGNIYFSLSTATSNDLRALGKQLGVSLYSVLLSGFYLLLRAYSNQDDIVIGSPIANRNYSQLADLLGFFVNTVAMRSQIDPTQSLAEYIRQVGAAAIEAQFYQDVPFEKVVNSLQISKDQSRHPLFQVLFGLQDFGSTAKIASHSVLFANRDEEVEIEAGLFSGYKVAKFDLTLMLNDIEEQISGVFNYATSLFSATTIERFIDSYQLILASMLKQQAQPIQKLNYLSLQAESLPAESLPAESLPAESHQVEVPVCQYWNGQQDLNQRDKTLPQLFAEQVARTPDNIAVIFGETQLTYLELNQKVNQLAHYLQSNYQIVKDDLIVLQLKRSEKIIIAILALLKAGAGYVPLDPNLPNERVSYILTNTAAKVVLTNQLYAANLNALIEGSSAGASVEVLDSNEERFLTYSAENLDYLIPGDSLAYVIYTSGTTGKPKGVLHEHHGLVNGILNEAASGILNSDSRVLGKTAYAYDPSLREMFLPLICGARLCMASEELIRDNAQLAAFIRCHAINLMVFVPSHLNIFISALEDANDYVTLVGITLFSCGEALNQNLLTKLVTKFKVNVYVQYGVSELSQVLYSYKVNTEGSQFYISANNRAYILDNNLRPSPIGAIGELYLGGQGLARGYLNLPELTAEKFIANPFVDQSAAGERLYKTGDLASYRSDGSIEYFGRNDFQVKVQGFRIELAEIENRFLSYPGIRQAVVVACEYSAASGEVGNKYLVAYYVALSKQDEEALRQHLAVSLAEYMLPSVLVHLTSLPLMANGKLDRQALPKVDFVNSANYVAPGSDVERKLCAIFANVLALQPEQIGINDDFFRLGGNSILSIKLVSKLNNSLAAHLKVAEVFSAKSVANLAKLLRISKQNSYQTLVKLNNVNADSTLYMFHPATGGCEVYSALANKLNSYYQCYGLDNYNLHHSVKYPNLASLAGYYLDIMREQGGLADSRSRVVLFGWCLGGLIALEVANLLEQQGYSNLELYLLDTVILDDDLTKITSQVDPGYIKGIMRQAMTGKYETSYVNKVIDNFDNENKIGKEKISAKLNTSKVYLYKAMQKDTRLQLDIIDSVFSVVKQIKYNNIETALNNAGEQLQLVRLDEAHHGNILDQDIVAEHLIANRY